MTASPGVRIGPYGIVGFIGVGGMGEVYRARDLKLNREVALKMLPASVAADRLTRFKREAHVLASLNHTRIARIASIYGFEAAGTVQPLILELVEGPFLVNMAVDTTIPSIRVVRNWTAGLKE